MSTGSCLHSSMHSILECIFVTIVPAKVSKFYDSQCKVSTVELWDHLILHE